MRRLYAYLLATETRHGLILGLGLVLGGGLDYFTNIVAGRWLAPVQYGIFISINAILQILALLAITIRIVVGFYTAELGAQPSSAAQMGSLLRRAWAWAWKWGLIGMAIMAACAPWLATQLRLPNCWPIWAGSLTVLTLFLRETTTGAFQGTLRFAEMGLLQAFRALLRILLTAVFLAMGGRAGAAILAWPLSCITGSWLAIRRLRPLLRQGEAAVGRSISWRYSTNTLLGLAAFGILTNLDAIFVKRFFSPEVAGNYGPVVTMAKISLYIPTAIGILLFPKVKYRQTVGRDSRPILWLALAAALAPGLGLTLLCFAFPHQVVARLFSGAYGNPGIVLGLANLAATVYSGLNIWLNYALSLERQVFVYILMGLVLCQAGGMVIFGRENLIKMTLVMVAAGLLGNLAGLAATWSARPATALKLVPEEVASTGS